ncbi:methanogenesis imperfect marker protein 11 [Methanomicrobium sp. W14]|nr:methanogenesis imperfect marker protein 11 [Methanomicrobium sp. W14]
MVSISEADIVEKGAGERGMSAYNEPFLPGNPYSVIYPEILAVASEDKKRIELIERFDCIGGAMWVRQHYVKSPLVKSSKIVGNTQRFMLDAGIVSLDLKGSYFPAGICGAKVEDEEISVTYLGMGGGGVGASVCRSSAGGVLRHRTDPCGGGKIAGSTIWLPKYTRVIIGLDDTDTPENGATWTLAHNISKAVEDENSRYLSHTITQLFPVPYRTKNCVAVACEFATTEPERLIDRFEDYVRKYTLSDSTGLCAYIGFDPSPLSEYACSVKKGEVKKESFDKIRKFLEIRMEGQGIIGAAASIPFYTNYDEALTI